VRALLGFAKDEADMLVAVHKKCIYAKQYDKTKVDEVDIPLPKSLKTKKFASIK
jgi:hypothetical protein